MKFDSDKIANINNGILKLSQYFNGLLFENEKPISFSKDLSDVFEDYKNNTIYRTRNNLSFIENVCYQILNFEYSFDKNIVWHKEGTDLEPKNFQTFLSTYINIYNLCAEIDLYFDRINPSNNNEDITLLEGDKTYIEFIDSHENNKKKKSIKDNLINKSHIIKKINSSYIQKDGLISAKYELDDNYVEACNWINKCKTESQRRNLLHVTYDENIRVFLQFNTINNIPIHNVFVADFICKHFDYFKNYKKGFKKGVNFFNENYKVPLPNIEQVKQISELYNQKFKPKILSINTIYNIENIKNIGFENGLLHAYSEFENSFINLFDNITCNQISNKINSINKVKISSYERSSIEDHLENLKDENLIDPENYEILIFALLEYFENNNFPDLKKTIKFARINKKRLGWILNRIFADFDRSINIDLLKFCKNNISTFKDLELDENDYKKSNIYKYFTTKTQ